ncbi:hypothetical protein BUALT_Bualt15G0005200 [Buddleja alternifolia]|uniref:Methyltransferase n=1 Tax=Buddleja alternifolia TaxID=168488 RepID=A0AAV6W9F4_9LAMI|nr:hypothetical protein BUALT_Bualt15G0005200 [Buddleja alternifolia]
MDSITLICTASLLACGLFWFVCIIGSAEQKGKVQDYYEQYQSFFRRPTEIETAGKWAWGKSFHLSPSIPGKSDRDATRLHEEMAVDLLNVKPGDKILDAGCGIGGPMREIAAHSCANVVGITINEYQVKRAKMHNKKAGLDKQCDVVCGNFLEMSFDDNTFDGAYSIEVTCHAPKLEKVYGEIYRVLKPGSLYVSYEWVTTELYRGDEDEHVEVIQGIKREDALPGLRSYKDIAEVAKRVGFEVVNEEDLASNPWWNRLKMGRIAYWRNRIVVTVLEWLGIAPKGTVDVHEMLFVTADYLTRGGETGIFTPMRMILCRKPESKSD